MIRPNGYIKTLPKIYCKLIFSPERYSLSSVGRMKFNRRIGRQEVEGESIYQTKILLMLKTMIAIRGKGIVDDIDHLGNRRVRSVGEMAENQFRLV